MAQTVITVKDLKEALAGLKDDAPVYTEGRLGMELNKVGSIIVSRDEERPYILLTNQTSSLIVDSGMQTRDTSKERTFGQDNLHGGENGPDARQHHQSGIPSTPDEPPTALTPNTQPAESKGKPVEPVKPAGK